MRPSSLSRKRVKDSSLLLAENENKRREESLTLFFSCFRDRKSTRLNSSHSQISYAVFCLKKKKKRLNVPLAPKKSKAARVLSNNRTLATKIPIHPRQILIKTRTTDSTPPNFDTESLVQDS